jgi:hypothetical protein
MMIRTDIANETLPEGYAYCDGSTLNASQQDINPGSNYTLPDLRNRYLLGADRTKVAGNTGSNGELPSDAPGPKGAAGTQLKTLVTGEMPQHYHDATASTVGGHNHGGGGQTSAAGDHSHSSGCHTFLVASSATQADTGFQGFNKTVIIPWGMSALSMEGLHSHSGSGDGQGAHSHTITINNEGSAQEYSKRPRFFGVVFVMKVRL